MRIPIALALYVSLAAGALADDAKTDWAAIHAAGLTAADHHNYDEAIECLRRSWLAAHTPEQKGISANDLGQTYRELQRPKEAREWLERAYEVWRANASPGHNLAVTASSLADVYRDLGDYTRAESLLREALGVHNNDPDSAENIRNSLADLLREEGRSSESRELFSASLQRAGASWEQRVNALIGLADIDRQTGDWDTSEKEWNEVLEMARRRKDEISEAIASRGLGSMWLSAGNPARAEPLFRAALSIMENNPAAKPQDIATALSCMAHLYRAQNKLALAQDAWSKALQLDRAAFGDVHPQVATVMEMLAEVYAQRGERELARDYATRALDTMTGLFGDNALPTAVAFANLAVVERLAGDLDGAAKDYERAIAVTRQLPAAGDAARGNDSLERILIQQYAALLKAMHRDREAKEISTLARSFRN